MLYRNLIALVLCLIYLSASAAVVESEKQKIRYDIITQGLDHPWSLAFLPNGEYLITERSGQLKRINKAGLLYPQAISGLPKIEQHGQGGLLDIALHPDFKNNRWVYLSYAEKEQGLFDNKYGTAVGRGKLINNRLEDFEVIFRMNNKDGKPYHFGSRLVFDRAGYLFITLGDRGTRDRAQDLNDHAGTVIRIHDDGRIPADNPFIGKQGIQPEIYSYGHRNIQGAGLDPETGLLWTHEHGPQGGDELNQPQPGLNYGWPVITYGKNYVTGSDIGEGTHKQGIQQPIHYWVPSIAPSGMSFYDGDEFPRWKNNLFVGSLKFRLLVRLEMDNGKVIREERLLKGALGRIRDVRQGPDGHLYLITDDGNGKLVKLSSDE